MDNILIIGAAGQLGQCLKTVAERRSITNVIFPSEMDANILKFALLNSLFEKEKPSYVINCAAYTAVDQAEDEVQGDAEAQIEQAVAHQVDEARDDDVHRHGFDGDAHDHGRPRAGQEQGVFGDTFVVVGHGGFLHPLRDSPPAPRCARGAVRPRRPSGG